MAGVVEEYGLWQDLVGLVVSEGSTVYTHTSLTGDHLGLHQEVKWLWIWVVHDVKVVHEDQRQSITQQPSNTEILHILSESNVQTLSNETFLVNPNVKYLVMNTDYINVSDMECLTQDNKLSFVMVSIIDMTNMNRHNLQLLVNSADIFCLFCSSIPVCVHNKQKMSALFISN